MYPRSFLLRGTLLTEALTTGYGDLLALRLENFCEKSTAGKAPPCKSWDCTDEVSTTPDSFTVGWICSTLHW